MDLPRWDGNPSGLPGATQALHHSATCCYTSGTENPLEETVWERESRLLTLLVESWISQRPFRLAGAVPSEQLRLRSREAPVDDFEIVGERFRYLTLPNPWADKLCTGTLWAQWP